MVSKKAKTLMAAMKAAMPIMEKLDIDKHRRAQDSIGFLVKPPKGTSCRDLDIGGIKAAWVTPPLSKELKEATTIDVSEQKVLLHCHGGAFTSGSLKYSKIFAAKIASITGLNVLTYEYRLAPEYPFPAALEDSLTVYSYLLHEKYLPKNIAVIGESAGGNLCLEIVNAGRARGLPKPQALVLLSPWLDISGSGETYYSLAEKDPAINPNVLMQSAHHYAGENDFKDPLISPVFADFADFPSTLIQVGTNEILLSDSTRLKDQMLEQGVQVELQLYEEMFHVFQMVDLPESRKALEEIRFFIEKALIYKE